MANYANASLEERIARRKKRQRAARIQKIVFAALIVLLLAGIFFLGYAVFSGGDEETENTETQVEENVLKEKPKKETPKKDTTVKETVNIPVVYQSFEGMELIVASIAEKLPATLKGANDEFAAQIDIPKVDPEKPMVALTFDDGPSPYYSNRILDVLEANGARATFFVVGSLVPGNEEILKRGVKLGCEFGNHSYDHPLTYNKLADSAAVKKQIDDTNAIIEGATGKKVTLMRTPGGWQGKKVTDVAELPIMMWSIDTLDWKTRNTDSIVKAVMNNVEDGDIILMHEIYKTSAEAAEIIVPKLIEEGYQVVTVSELAEARGVELKPAKVYEGPFKPKKE